MTSVARTEYCNQRVEVRLTRLARRKQRIPSDPGRGDGLIIRKQMAVTMENTGMNGGNEPEVYRDGSMADIRNFDLTGKGWRCVLGR